MKIFVTGACGFVGSALCRAFSDAGLGHVVFGLDNLIRPGSEVNRSDLKRRGVKLFHGDLRAASDLESIPAVDWVIDAAASPSVLAGVDGRMSSRQLVEHNLGGTLNTLEYCKTLRAGFVLLSTSRVYSIETLAALPVRVAGSAFVLGGGDFPAGFSAAGLAESFSTAAPVSLYGSTKLASEALALEYGAAFGFPVFINRCGVLAGAGQFGRPDQGIFAYWLNAHLRRRPLKYIGFDGRGHQVRDCLHPRDLVSLLDRQMAAGQIATHDRIVNCSGGLRSARSLRQLTEWCDSRFGAHTVEADPTPRPYDLPWVVLDSDRARRIWGWEATSGTEEILEEIARHAEDNPGWLELSASH